MRNLFISLVLAAIAIGSAATETGANTQAQKLDRALFAEGCFWKTQYIFSKVPGVIRTRVGYSGGTTSSPSYEQVCSNNTGHAETVQVEFDPSKVTYRKLLEVFWSSHDPTTVNRQGPDFGTQYRSVVFYTSPAQRDQALAYKDELNRSHRFGGAIVTEIRPAGPFYAAEEYHQNYYQNHGTVCF